ncbi:predicted protein [Mycobacterium tuberculosis variant africanum K85]|uniref:Uncharacterized protein n=1 Tax=Mycobacterium tuberculosis variant africanum K85 TaxID=611304 RepID=A0A9P2H6A3_MYCTX|nr:predicted protein [Mycobacterium tuberculosis variant africanum K85]
MGTEQPAIAVDTSSAPAVNNPVVLTAAAALAELIADPIPAKSAAAATTSSGETITHDIACLPTPHGLVPDYQRHTRTGRN